MDEGLHHGQQLVQDHSDALVAKKFGNAFEVNRSNEVFVLVEDERVGLVQSLVSPQEMGSLGFGLVPLHRLRERDVVGLDEPVERTRKESVVLVEDIIEKISKTQ